MVNFVTAKAKLPGIWIVFLFQNLRCPERTKRVQWPIYNAQIRRVSCVRTPRGSLLFHILYQKTSFIFKNP